MQILWAAPQTMHQRASPQRGPHARLEAAPVGSVGEPPLPFGERQQLRKGIKTAVLAGPDNGGACTEPDQLSSADCHPAGAQPGLAPRLVG